MGKQACVKSYPQEFRDTVVKLMRVRQLSPWEVAERFSISEDSMRHWVS